jgi:hypothetical protein
VNGTCRAGQVVDLIGFHIERKRDVVTLQFEVGVAVKMSYIPLRPREEVVDAEHLMSVPDQAIAQMRAEKARAAGNQYLGHLDADSFLATSFMKSDRAPARHISRFMNIRALAV